MNLKKILVLVIFMMCVPVANAVFFQEGNRLEPGALNVSFVMGKNFTFSEITVYNDSIKLNDTVFKFIPQPVGLGVNLTLNNFTPTWTLFNVTVETTENVTANASVTVSGGGGGGATSTPSSIFYNETLEGYNTTNTTTTFVLETGGDAELELGYATFLYVNFYDERTGLRIDNDVSMVFEIWSDKFSANYTFTGNNYSFDRLDIGEYEVRYSDLGSDYDVRSYYVDVAENSNQTLKLYMLNASYSTYILARTTDTAGIPIENGTIKVLRKFITTNAWEVVEMTKTDMNGEGAFYLEMFDVPYRFQVELNDVLYKYTDPLKVKQTTLFIKNVNLLGEGLLSYFGTRDVPTNLSWNNGTSSFEFTWADSSGFIRGGRLHVERLTAFTTTDICDTTVYAAAATIECNLTEYIGENGQFAATGWIDSNTNNSWWISGVDVHQFYTENVQMWGLSGIFYTFLLITTLALAALWNPNVTVIFATVGLIVSVAFGMFPLAAQWLAGIIIIAIIGVKMQGDV